MQNANKTSKFNFYKLPDKKIRENILQRRSHSFVIGYEILKHFKNQKSNREKRKHKKSFNDQNLNSDSKPKETRFPDSPNQTIKEEEIKSAKDFDSKQLTGSNRTYEQIDLASVQVETRVRVIRDENWLAPAENKKKKYGKMLHFSNLREIGSKQDELKELHKDYFLINYFGSSTVRGTFNNRKSI